MIFAFGLSNYSVAIFHLANHAFFKALLFLGVGMCIKNSVLTILSPSLRCHEEL